LAHLILFVLCFFSRNIQVRELRKKNLNIWKNHFAWFFVKFLTWLFCYSKLTKTKACRENTIAFLLFILSQFTVDHNIAFISKILFWSLNFYFHQWAILSPDLNPIACFCRKKDWIERKMTKVKNTGNIDGSFKICLKSSF
jgi:hypothetical protein